MTPSSSPRATSTSPTPPTASSGLNDDPAKELDFNGVYRLSAKRRHVTLLTKELTFPNGIAFSPDEKTLYVANSDPEEGDLDGLPGERGRHPGHGACLCRRDAAGSARRRGLPDGMKVDQAGNLFATGPRRHPDLRPRRHPPRHVRHRPGHRQLRLGRRRLDPLHHGRHVPGRIKLTTKGRGF